MSYYTGYTHLKSQKNWQIFVILTKFLPRVWVVGGGMLYRSSDSSIIGVSTADSKVRRILTKRQQQQSSQVNCQQSWFANKATVDYKTCGNTRLPNHPTCDKDGSRACDIALSFWRVQPFDGVVVVLLYSVVAQNNGGSVQLLYHKMSFNISPVRRLRKYELLYNYNSTLKKKNNIMSLGIKIV